MAGDTTKQFQVVLDFLRFRIATAVGAVLALLGLFLPTFLTWFSGNPAVYDPPATLVSRWNLWSILTNGDGAVGFTGGLSSGPTIATAGPSFASAETGFATAVVLCLLVTVLALVVTAVRASWVAALVVAIGATATFAFEAVLRANGDGESVTPRDPASFFAGNGMALAQWAAAVVAVWAVYVCVVARRDWQVRFGVLVALSEVN